MTCLLVANPAEINFLELIKTKKHFLQSNIKLIYPCNRTGSLVFHVLSIIM